MNRAACAGLMLTSLIPVAAYAAGVDYDLVDPAKIPNLPELAPTLNGKSADTVVALFGAPLGTQELGSSQFAIYEVNECLSKPHCYVTASCRLTVTISKATSTVTSAALSGNVFGSPGARVRFLQYLSQLCNAEFAVKAKQGTP